MSDQTTSGGCLCGAVRYAVSGAPLWVAHCHCQSCRRATGAVMATYVGFPRQALAFVEGAPQRIASSPGVARSFCGACGSPLAYEGERWPDEIHVHLGTLDAPETFRPQAHVYTAEQLPWLRLADQLPRFRTTPSGS